MENHKYPAVTLFSKLPILKELFVKMAICVFEVKKYRRYTRKGGICGFF